MNQFYAYMARLKLIRRWGLMRNTQSENDAEHSLQVAMMAHGIALLGKTRYGRDVDEEHVIALAVYHDAVEVMTGDMPTPVKYFDPEIKAAYASVENKARESLVAMLPPELQEPVNRCMGEKDTYEARIVKAADKISAYVKCLEEERAGNHEFDYAAKTIRSSLDAIDIPEVQDFLHEMIPAFLLTLDELNSGVLT